MTDEAPRVFDAQAQSYEAERRRLIPPYDAFYGTAVAALELSGRPLRRVLDLGAGTGLLSRQVADAHPEAALTLLDGAPAMLAQARAFLGDRADLLVASLADPLPAGPWDAVISALAIHHLDDEGKRNLFARVHAALAPGGLFVNAEQVAGPTAFFEDVYAAWHERSAFEAGATEAEWSASQARKALDSCAGVERQLQWLRASGFADADCLFQNHCFAVLVARRSG